jgi:hypothetical protein
LNRQESVQSQGITRNHDDTYSFTGMTGRVSADGIQYLWLSCRDGNTCEQLGKDFDRVENQTTGILMHWSSRTQDHSQAITE